MLRLLSTQRSCTTVLLLDANWNVLAKESQGICQLYSQPGWVEHSPEDIWHSVTGTIQQAIKVGRINPSDIKAIGITNQRETTVLWNRETGEAVHDAIVWQCRRSAAICQQLKDRGLESLFKEKTGLVIDPYFSGTKLTWMFENLEGIYDQAEDGKLAFGTIDSFLVSRLTGLEAHVTDVSNASRTLMMNINTCEWDTELLNLLQVPEAILPKIVSNSEIYGKTKNVPGLPNGIPIAGMAGDQQAALFGQGCFQEGSAKCTFGTGAFLLTNTGKNCLRSESGLLSSVAWKLGNEVFYCLEGSVFIAGA
ncbi:hypothetical protein LCGC14_3135670, partial [marine sediment metagenome]